MSDSTPNTLPNESATPTPGIPKLDPVSALSALGSEVRWPIVKLLADGRKLSISEAAAAVGGGVDAVSRQLKVLANSGVVGAFAGEDRRQTVYQIPAAFRPAPNVLDFGFCLVRLDKL